MINITDNSAGFVGTIPVALRSERAPELHDASVVQTLLSNEERLRGFTPGLADSNVIWVPIHQIISTAADWAVVFAGTPAYPYLAAGEASMFATASLRCHWHLQPFLPQGGQIVSCGIMIQGASGHSYPIQYPPELTLVQLDPAYLPQHVADAYQVADPGTGVEYETLHTLGGTLTSPMIITPGLDIWMVLGNEYGANSAANLAITAAYVVVAHL